MSGGEEEDELSSLDLSPLGISPLNSDGEDTPLDLASLALGGGAPLSLCLFPLPSPLFAQTMKAQKTR